MTLRPTELLLVGNPRGGTPLMQDRQTTGLDLPLRALAWEDADGRCVGDDERRRLAWRHCTASARRARPPRAPSRLGSRAS